VRGGERAIVAEMNESAWKASLRGIGLSEGRTALDLRI
jgi:hypothetical protein